MSAPVRMVVAGDDPLAVARMGSAIGEPSAVVVAATCSPVAGLRDAIVRHQPGVVVVLLGTDPEPPTEQIAAVMADCACPILALSHGAGDAASAAAIGALQDGAVDARPEPAADDDLAELRRHLRMLSGVAVISRRPAGSPAPAGRDQVVALVASTGGPPALRTVLETMGPVPVPVLLVQHIDPGFLDGFATWLQRTTGLDVAVAANGDPARPGVVHVAPAGTHLLLGAEGRLRLDPEPETLHRPSGDILLGSLARRAPGRAVGVVLTGMGEDGARGLREIVDAGGTAFAQDEATCAVFGMPRAAARLTRPRVLPLDEIGPAVAARVGAASRPLSRSAGR